MVRTRPDSVEVSLADLAQMIDHSLLHPTMTDDEVLEGLEIAKKYGVATACIKPYHILFAKLHLRGSEVGLCPVIAFPHGNSTTEVKVFEAIRAVEECKADNENGRVEIDVVVNVGRVLSGKWEFVERELSHINNAITERGAILKVIFENDYLQPMQIIRLSQICTKLNIAFIKTSTGYGFVKDSKTGDYNYRGATIEHLELMSDNSGGKLEIKAAGGIRTLDDLLRMRALGVSRVGATATIAILEEAKKRGIGEYRVSVKVQW
ncbi:hypothetical protein BJ875DRAFT_462870 [Amylocarpus encephaloides]|uniref:deoxyribose-phosphate aldolase n=1 Tax=Amylocarpus encephaloides TaxID=45428 RepID=A0A9P8C4V5_9HELO|nr:hypothetical protein BJ875DRAFT_462870 [Amylocarpus encephaloides]